MNNPIERADGSKHWYKNNQRHRENGPAIEYADGSKHWYKNDQLHREDGPAIEEADGSKYWLKDDKLHRVDGPAIERADGSKHWYKDGEPTKGENKMEIIMKWDHSGDGKESQVFETVHGPLFVRSDRECKYYTLLHAEEGEHFDDSRSDLTEAELDDIKYFLNKIIVK